MKNNYSEKWIYGKNNSISLENNLFDNLFTKLNKKIKGSKLYVLKSVVGIVVKFMMLLIVFTKIGLYLLIHYIW